MTTTVDVVGHLVEFELSVLRASVKDVAGSVGSGASASVSH